MSQHNSDSARDCVRDFSHQPGNAIDEVDLAEYDALMQRLDADGEGRSQLSPARPGRWPGGSSDRFLRLDA
jgi:hypothetical protein